MVGAEVSAGVVGVAVGMGGFVGVAVGGGGGGGAVGVAVAIGTVVAPRVGALVGCAPAGWFATGTLAWVGAIVAVTDAKGEIVAEGRAVGLETAAAVGEALVLTGCAANVGELDDIFTKPSITTLDVATVPSGSCFTSF